MAIQEGNSPINQSIQIDSWVGLVYTLSEATINWVGWNILHFVSQTLLLLMRASKSLYNLAQSYGYFLKDLIIKIS